jgi:PTS system sucrose-specific IIC component
MGKPFLTAGLGAGFGGAFAMAMQVASTTWGPSGVIALSVMTGGPNGPVMSVVYYAIALVISYVMGYVITNIAIKHDDVADV